jgi:hypothetical protein
LKESVRAPRPVPLSSSLFVFVSFLTRTQDEKASEPARTPRILPHLTLIPLLALALGLLRCSLSRPGLERERPRPPPSPPLLLSPRIFVSFLPRRRGVEGSKYPLVPLHVPLPCPLLFRRLGEEERTPRGPPGRIPEVPLRGVPGTAPEMCSSSSHVSGSIPCCVIPCCEYAMVTC